MGRRRRPRRPKTARSHGSRALAAPLSRRLPRPQRPHGESGAPLHHETRAAFGHVSNDGLAPMQPHRVTEIDGEDEVDHGACREPEGRALEKHSHGRKISRPTSVEATAWHRQVNRGRNSAPRQQTTFHPQRLITPSQVRWQSMPRGPAKSSLALCAARRRRSLRAGIFWKTTRRPGPPSGPPGSDGAGRRWGSMRAAAQPRGLSGSIM
jgi:hypothetical protein